MSRKTVLLAITSILIPSMFGFFEFSNAAIEEEMLTALDGEAGDDFGISVSISGDRAIVGARWDDLGTILKAGSAYVFEMDAGGNWVQTDHLTASSPIEDALFGSSVSISGDRIIVGARGTDLGSIESAGAAYVFELDAGGNWILADHLTASSPTRGNSFGRSVSISGDTAMVGDDEEEVGSIQNAGSVYVFERDAGGNWKEMSKITALDGEVDDGFGYSVSISGDRAIVSAMWDDDDGSSSGSAYVFERDAGGNWVQKPKLTASDASSFDYFGRSVSISGDKAIVGTTGNDGGQIGSSYIFERDVAGNWVQTDQLSISGAGVTEGSHGISVSILGDKAMVGSPYDEVGSIQYAGSAYVFERDVTGDWIQIDHITASNVNRNAGLGSSVSISGDKAIVGALGDEINGSANGSAWIMFLNVDLMVWDGDAGDGLWSNPINWSKDEVPQSEDYIIIRNAVGFGSAVHLDVDFTLSNQLFVEQGINAASKNVLVIDSGNTLTIEESATLENHGELYIDPGAIISNSGTLNNENAGLIESQGGLYNSGTLNNNDGVIYNTEFSTILNYDIGYISNNGIITNLAVFQNIEGSKVNNYGIIDNLGTFANVNSVINNLDGNIHNTEFGTIQNLDLSTINNDAVIDNHGRINNYCGSLINNNGIISGNPIVTRCDTDGDGIFDEIDLNPTDPNVVDFSDNAIPTPTTGRIITTGSQTITIMDMPDPRGVYIAADSSGGPVPAEISVCGGTSTVFLSAGSQTIVTCGSVTIEVISETVSVDFFGNDGTVATATISEGNSIEFDPTTWNFIALDDNLDNVTINYADTDFNLVPGSAKVVPEFNTIAILILAITIISIIALSSRTKLRIFPQNFN